MKYVPFNSFANHTPTIQTILGYSVKASRCHLRGAQLILEKLFKLSPQSKFVRFLSKLFMYFDIMVAFSLREPPLCNWTSNPYASILTSLHGVDPSFGLAGSMWPSLYHLAELVARKESSPSVASEAQDLALDLLSQKDYYPDKPPDSPLTDDSYESLVQIAHSLRYSALLVIYTDLMDGDESVPPDSIRSTYDAALHALLRASVLHSDAMLTTLWPLHTVGMRATSSGDRIIIRRIFEKLKVTQNMKCVDIAWEQVKKSWEGGETPGAVGRNEILFA